MHVRPKCTACSARGEGGLSHLVHDRVRRIEVENAHPDVDRDLLERALRRRLAPAAVHLREQDVVGVSIEVARRGPRGAGAELLPLLGTDEGYIHGAVVRLVLLSRAAVAAEADVPRGELPREDLILVAHPCPCAARGGGGGVQRVRGAGAVVAVDVVGEPGLLVLIVEVLSDPARDVIRKDRTVIK